MILVHPGFGIGLPLVIASQAFKRPLTSSTYKSRFLEGFVFISFKGPNLHLTETLSTKLCFTQRGCWVTSGKDLLNEHEVYHQPCGEDWSSYTTPADTRLSNGSPAVHRKDCLSITIHTCFTNNAQRSSELCPVKTGVAIMDTQVQHVPKVSSIAQPIFIRDGTQEGFNMISAGVPSPGGMSSTGTIRETTPLLPWLTGHLISDLDLTFLSDVSTNKHVNTWFAIHHRCTCRFYPRTIPSPPWQDFTNWCIRVHFTDLSPKKIAWREDVLQQKVSPLGVTLPTKNNLL